MHFATNGSDESSSCTFWLSRFPSRESGDSEFAAVVELVAMEGGLFLGNSSPSSVQL